MDFKEKQHLREQTKSQTSTVAVFWIENGLPHVDVKTDAPISESLSFCEALRQRARQGEAISHVCVSSELSGNVTLPGVSAKLPDDYNWTKRREHFVPGRPSVGSSAG